MAFLHDDSSAMLAGGHSVGSEVRTLNDLQNRATAVPIRDSARDSGCPESSRFISCLVFSAKWQLWLMMTTTLMMMMMMILSISSSSGKSLGSCQFTIRPASSGGHLLCLGHR
jgi:hypothetical protein